MDAGLPADHPRLRPEAAPCPTRSGKGQRATQASGRPGSGGAAMNGAYDDIIGSSDADRGALFVETAARLGTAVQNVEKDFWVCWTLDALFNGLEREALASSSWAAHP